jgi:hypothetical protein
MYRSRIPTFVRIIEQTNAMNTDSVLQVIFGVRQYIPLCQHTSECLCSFVNTNFGVGRVVSSEILGNSCGLFSEISERMMLFFRKNLC